jgi:imidazole glycerol-phosphate synthase subunit HisH
MIGIVNYGLGNIHAFINIYKRLNIEAAVASKPDELLRASRIVLPGVGAFDRAMTRLNESGMRDLLEELVVGEHRPVLGICVGMQMLAERSEEGVQAGLGWIAGEVKKFDESAFARKPCLPHMGWNDVLTRRSDSLFKNLDTGAKFYFLHSYYFSPRSQDHVVAVTDYNGLFPSSVRCGNIFGVQFHPEKSHQWGIQLLKNFAEI